MLRFYRAPLRGRPPGGPERGGVCGDRHEARGLDPARRDRSRAREVSVTGGRADAHARGAPCRGDERARALSLRGRVAWLAERGAVEVVVPGPGPAADLYADIALGDKARLPGPDTCPGPRAKRQGLRRGFRRDVVDVPRPDPRDTSGSRALRDRDASRCAGGRTPRAGARRFSTRRRSSRPAARRCGGAADEPWFGSPVRRRPAVAACSETVAAQYGATGGGHASSDRGRVRRR